MNKEHFEREKLELTKLQLEIDQLRLAWWKRPVYIGALTPLALGILVFLSGILSGYFDTRRQKLEAEVSQLQTEKQESIYHLSNIQNEIRVRESELQALSSSNLWNREQLAEELSNEDLKISQEATNNYNYTNALPAFPQIR
jgi:hypothetical protein